MKKTSSLVWRFFDRLEDNKRCVAVLCKLCDTQYKYFGNTTNLRTHLVNKHPIQWDLLQNGTLDESTFRALDDDDSTNQAISSPPKRRKYVKSYKNDNVRYSVSVDNRKASRNEAGEQAMPVIEIQRVDVLENSDNDNDNNPVDNDLLVRQMHHRGSDEEWLDEEVYQPHVDPYGSKRKKMKVKHIKREVQSPPPPPPQRHLSNYVVQPAKTYQPKTEKIYIDNTPRKDEYSVFGEYVANKLRKFRGVQTRGNIQQLITTILWQAEYGMYDNMESVKRIILHSVQDMETETQTHDEAQIPDGHGEEQVQMVIERGGQTNLTEEPITIIDAHTV